MPHDAQVTALFFDRAGLDRARVGALVDDALAGCDDGALFLEYRQSEGFSLDDGRIRSASFDTAQGFGLHAEQGETVGFAHATLLDDQAIARAADTVKAVRTGSGGTLALPPQRTNRHLYTDANPIEGLGMDRKVSILSAIDAYARAKDPRVAQVMASLSASWQAVYILRPGGEAVADIRPLVRMNVAVVTKQGERMESGSYGCGGRMGYESFVTEERWQAAVDEALRQALVNLESIDAPAGEMPVVLGSGWPGVMLHEAVGHGLEGDFNRKKTSAFSGRLGDRVAAPGVTVVDDGTLADRRGSLSVDDEGTPTSRTVLIEDGILKGYMQDRMNARLMGVAPTGNGRRESHAHPVLPRMTNTTMEAGDKDPAEIIQSVKKGLYAVNFGGGQVDITSGKFVFSASEAYLIEDGKIGPAVKGATLIGHGPEAMTRVSMIGNDLALDPGIGTCGKEGQGVPVGVGQPTMLIDRLTVGGTSAA
ncbi:metalloprotease TldD [Roseospira marina]|uniref:Metalloprotease TldD n=1 Tax=Roseospira marina TaxID=140057 RepID=A0A5M6IGU8_9PROT|nr:metalloprotease TldD [Roseospira marina]KAA5607454.1 metalloprotease TldD [Roseospira marina]MBB4312366.1 TldD protein [Roseospira marina]MBB5085618.1 TldD protein [Roseospira marina]